MTSLIRIQKLLILKTVSVGKVFASVRTVAYFLSCITIKMLAMFFYKIYTGR